MIGILSKHLTLQEEILELKGFGEKAYEKLLSSLEEDVKLDA